MCAPVECQVYPPLAPAQVGIGPRAHMEPLGWVPLVVYTAGMYLRVEFVGPHWMMCSLPCTQWLPCACTVVSVHIQRHHRMYNRRQEMHWQLRRQEIRWQLRGKSYTGSLRNYHEV